jgi:hypothetical protein
MQAVPARPLGRQLILAFPDGNLDGDLDIERMKFSCLEFL